MERLDTRWIRSLPKSGSGFFDPETKTYFNQRANLNALWSGGAGENLPMGGWRAVRNQNGVFDSFAQRPDGSYAGTGDWDNFSMNGMQFQDYDESGNFERDGTLEGFRKDNFLMDTLLPFAMVAAPFAGMIAGGAAGAGAVAPAATGTTGAATGAGTAAAELAAGAGLGAGAPLGAEALAAYAAMPAASQAAVASALGMTPEAFAALGSAGLGSAGAAAGLGAGTAAGTGAAAGGAAGGGSSFLGKVGSALGLGGGAGGGGAGGFSWTDLIQPAISVAGGLYGAHQTGKATDAMLQAQRESQALFEPWRKAGEWGVNRLATVMGREGPEAARAAFETDPGYQWRLEQGQKALERSAAARGGLYSGKAIKDTIRFGQGEASQEFGNTYNRLSNLAGLGQTATGQSAGYRSAMGDAQAAGIMGRANALTGAIGTGLSMYNDAQSRKQENSLMHMLLANRGYA